MKTYKIIEERTYHGVKFHVYRKSIFGFWYDVYIFGSGWGCGHGTYANAKSYVENKCYDNKIVKEKIIKCK